MSDTDRTPIVPDWLNIDAICPPDVRAQLEEFADKAEKMARELDFLARLSFLTLRRADEVEPDGLTIPADADLFGHEIHLDIPADLFAYVSGKDRLRNAMYRLAHLAMAGADDPEGGTVPEWWAAPDGSRPDGTVISLPKWESWHSGLPFDDEVEDNVQEDTSAA